MAAEDWLPTLVAAAGGDPDLKEKLLTGYTAGEKTFRNHLDGYNFMPFFQGQAAESPRREFFYFSDNADLMAVRYNQWKITFKTIVGNLFSGKEDMTNVPMVTNLRVDPWERYQTESTSYGEWWGKKLWVMMPATVIMGKFLATFEGYPPSQASGSISVEKALQALQEGGRKN
jgi:arylsulfatase